MMDRDDWVFAICMILWVVLGVLIALDIIN